MMLRYVEDWKGRTDGGACRRRLRSFMRWMESHGIEVSEGMEIVGGVDCKGMGIRAAYDFQEGDIVACIPKDACLTLKTTGAAQILSDARLGGGLGLAVALMYERSLAEASPWFPYLNTLPRRHDLLPIVWDPADINALLLGTELHSVVMQDRKLIEEDWRECVWPLTQLHPIKFSEQYFTLEEYFSAKTLVASRSFKVDSLHGDGLVPLADLFNHKTCGEDVHVMKEEADSDLFERTVSYGMNTVNEEGKCWGSSLVEETTVLERDLQSPSETPGRTDVLEIVLIRDVSRGSEIFNTYGDLSNASLLHRHGFTQPDNPYDLVNIDFTLVMVFCALFFSARHSRNRMRLWRKYGCSALRSQNEEYFEINVWGKPQPELLFLLYILHLSETNASAADFALFKLEAANKDNCDLDWNVKAVQTIANLRNACLVTNLKHEACCLDTAFLTFEVSKALLWLSDKRDKVYGETLLEEDQKLLDGVDPKSAPKLFHALSLRVSERSILNRLRYFACGTNEKSRKV